MAEIQVLTIACIYVGLALLSWAVTRGVRQYAIRRMLLDHPNHRSLHTSPTPRGGGLSIAITVLSVILLLWIAEYIPDRIALATLVGGIVVALTGWLDDNRDVSIVIRLVLYLLASGWACYWISGMPLDSPVLHPVEFLLRVLALTWMINLYNFMDGSDALAASQGVFAAAVTAILLFAGGSIGPAYIMLALAASCSGFLIWNWPPARIFMGDIGSCFTGFMFGIWALITWDDGALSPAIWLVVLSLFICDASLTLLKRFFTGARWYQAHRSHAYQLAIQSGLSHKQLIYIILLLFMALLLPLSWLAYRYEDLQWGVTAFVYCMAALLWLLIQSWASRSGN